MSIYQRFRVEELGSRLARAGILRIWPQLTSSDPSLDHQPAVSALGRALSDRRHIVLVGPAGSGKTILSLQFATTDQRSTAAYLEAQRWAPAVGESMLTQFLTAAGCDVDSATKAFERGNLVVILDAIDEAPWRARGASIRDAVCQLSEELDGKAGMLITSRVAAYVPPLASANVTATLSGVRSEQIEAFLNLYSSSRRGISELADTLKRLPFSENIKYSPLILRLLAESLEAGDIPENLTKLFEKIADFHINRECAKVDALTKNPRPGTWQHCYSNPLNHTLLISGLLFNTHEQRQELSEAEFSSAVSDLLGPTTLGAHALVDLSTLMAEHPLVSVTYSPKEGADYYRIEAGHDWVRTSLLPKFLSDDCLTAQIYALETFHKTLPPPDDFVSAWSDLDNY